jgi:hypothetical protein
MTNYLIAAAVVAPIGLWLAMWNRARAADRARVLATRAAQRAIFGGGLSGKDAAAETSRQRKSEFGRR